MQLTLPIKSQQSYHIDDFIVSKSNHNAYNSIMHWQNTWGVEPYRFSLLIQGMPSSGKTHLARIWQKLCNAYIIEDTLNSSIINNYQAFIIEDIETKYDEYKLLHNFNIINENQKYLLMTTMNDVNQFNLKDVLSRINSLLVVRILKPDDELIRMLLFKHFSNQSIHVSNKVINFLLIRLPRKLNQMIYLVEQINQLALTHQRKITIPLIKQVITKYDL